MRRRTFVGNILCAPAILALSGGAVGARDLDNILHLAKHRNGAGSAEHFGAEHTFGYLSGQLRKFASMPACRVIKFHGQLPYTPNGWRSVEFEKSRWTVFSDPEIGVQDLSLVDLGKIISGESRNWSAFGGPSLEIQLITNYGLPLQGLHAMMHENGLDHEAFRTAKSLPCFGYRAMLERAEKTPGALVLGLREVAPEGLTAVKIDGIGFSLSKHQSYPLERSFSILVRNDDAEATRQFREYLVTLNERRKIDEAVGYYDQVFT